MTQEERWAFAISWVDGHSRKICGYVYNRYLLDYSAYEMQDFLAEAYLVAYDALSACGNTPLEGFFWTLFKHQCKTLANKPHYSREINIVDICAEQQSEERALHDLSDVVEKILPSLSCGQKELVGLIAEADSRLTVNDIAKILDISPQAVRQRLSGALSALSHLREIIKQPV